MGRYLYTTQIMAKIRLGEGGLDGKGTEGEKRGVAP